jgi:hypothetical protein
MTTKIKSGLIADNAIVSAHISSGAISSAHLSSIDTDNVSEGSSNLYFTTARARTSLSVTDSGGDGSLAYDNSTGAITYTGPSAAEVRAHFSAGTNTAYSTGQFSISDSTIRSKFSVTDSGGDGSLSYSTGAITYTGPSAAEVRAHLSAGTGVTYSSGAISIGQSVATTASPTFADINVTGNINVTGDLNTVSVADLDVTDQTITLGAGQNEASSGGSGIVVDGSGASLLWDESNDEFDFNKGINVTGAITSSGASSFTDLAIGGAADSNYDLKVYGLSRFQGTANFVSSGNVIQVGGQTILDASKNLSNIGTISSGAITMGAAALTLNGSLGTWSVNSEGARMSFGRGSANYIDAVHESGYLVFQTSNGETALTLNSSQNATFAGTISSGALTATEVNISNGDLNFTKVDGIGINAKESLAITIDSDNNDSSRVFSILDGSGSTLMQVTDTGNATFLGNVVASESVTSVGGVVNTNTGSNPF